MDEQQNIIIYRTADGRASVARYAKDGKTKKRTSCGVRDLYPMQKQKILSAAYTTPSMQADAN